jgi:hypothetical protein
MSPDCGASTFDFVGERLELAGNVLLDQHLLVVAEEFEPRRDTPGVVEADTGRGRRQLGWNGYIELG